MSSLTIWLRWTYQTIPELLCNSINNRVRWSRLFQSSTILESISSINRHLLYPTPQFPSPLPTTLCCTEFTQTTYFTSNLKSDNCVLLDCVRVSDKETTNNIHSVFCLRRNMFKIDFNRWEDDPTNLTVWHRAYICLICVYVYIHAYIPNKKVMVWGAFLRSPFLQPIHPYQITLYTCWFLLHIALSSFCVGKCAQPIFLQQVQMIFCLDVNKCS